ncbi:MAG: TRAP transporter small permease [Phycisphaerae bacterium]|jgi:TRAP-type C4-dicarboxylate transport system permease small subunit
MIKYLEKTDTILRKILVSTAAIFLLAMLFLTCVNIVTRRFSLPIQGTFELTGLFGAVAGAAALGYTQKKKENIAVDILVNHMPKSVRTTVSVINDFVCAAFSALAAWQIIKIGLTHIRSGEVTETLRIVSYPFIFLTAAGFAALGFVFVIDMLKTVTAGGEKQP